MISHKQICDSIGTITNYQEICSDLLRANIHQCEFVLEASELFHSNITQGKTIIIAEIESR